MHATCLRDLMFAGQITALERSPTDYLIKDLRPAVPLTSSLTTTCPRPPRALTVTTHLATTAVDENIGFDHATEKNECPEWVKSQG